MTHTLHRTGVIESLKEDYVMLFLTAPGINRDEIGEGKMGQIGGIISHYKNGVVNYGNTRTGNCHRAALEDMNKTTRIGHVVFKDREALKACLKEIKDRDFGISVVVSGIYEDVANICKEIGLSPHTVAVSLGVHGKTERLPDADLLEITTMCGHHLVSSNLLKKMMEKIGDGKMTHKEAATELSKQCGCGVFNLYRAEKLLTKLTSKEFKR